MEPFGHEARAEAKLEDSELWQAFHSITNEMIVTKLGRRMFPVIKISIKNLDPRAMYLIAIEFVQLESHKWKYVNGEWTLGGKSDQSPTRSVYLHPESPNFGHHWMKDHVNFSKTKLTNKPTNAGGQVVLNSLHKYQPRIHIIKDPKDFKFQESSYIDITALLCSGEKVESFEFEQTKFIAVTAYQNEKVSSQTISPVNLYSWLIHSPIAQSCLISARINANTLNNRSPILRLSIIRLQKLSKRRGRGRWTLASTSITTISTAR